MSDEMKDLTGKIEEQANNLDEIAKKKEEVEAVEQDAVDEYGNLVKLIPTPNFTDCQAVGTLLPINMANEIVSNISRAAEQENLVEFIRVKLGYTSKIKVCKCFSSEQIDALVLAIKAYEQGNGFIIGDMAGIGKGRVCAGIMRFAYMNNIIPVFITQKPYLFNDIYRDFADIEGIGSDSTQVSILPKPLVLHSDGVIMTINGNSAIPTAQGVKVSTPDGQVKFTYINDKKPNSINEICRVLTEDIEKSGNVSLGQDFNCVMLPYSIISQGQKQLRRNFLKSIAPNAYFVFDESHNAASSNASSNVLRHSLELVEKSKGVLFSSATYAKNPNVFGLYVVKTSLSKAVPSLESINDALKVGGENVAEYIASGLCKEGQMIRRVRSFSDCPKITEYVGMKRDVDAFGNTVYQDMLDDKQGEFFNEAIQYYKQMRDFAISDRSKKAVKNAIDRAIRNLGYLLADEKGLKSISSESDKTKRDKLRKDWISRNRNKWVAEYETDNISRYKATFRSNLFLAVKAKYAADKVIECLNTPIPYTNIDGTTGYAPQKPVIAIATTGETIFSDLDLKDGDRIQNDFSVYLQSIYNRLFRGKLVLRQVDGNFFESKKDLAADGIDITEEVTEWVVTNSDFDDFGAQVDMIQAKLAAYQSNLPFSVIDYIRDRIETTRRSSVYFDDPNMPVKAKYGNLSSPNYTFQEGTSRSHMLVKDGNEWVYTKNNRIKSTSALFKGFNNGNYDVMLINVVASTGGSAQSSFKEGMDVRPRNMFVIQFELDINVEVQKRGRVNRTGQINFPTYTYIITKIPVETRMYLMLRKKLRKLDANTSADQTASSKTAEITDYRGNPIEDIFNNYGYDVFVNQFIADPANAKYKTILDGLKFMGAAAQSAASTAAATGNSAEEKEVKLEQFNSFIRELELYPTDIQESFFNQMNSLYAVEKANLDALGEWQEELRPKNYKAALKQRVVRQLNSGDTIFSMPLFMADYYTLDDFVPKSKDWVEKKMKELAVWEGQKMSPQDYWVNFNNDFSNELADFAVKYLLILNEKRPVPQDYATTVDYDDAVAKFDLATDVKLSAATSNMRQLQEMIEFFVPGKAVTMLSPDGYYMNGRFVGFRVHKSQTQFKYSASNIEFIFCFLSHVAYGVMPKNKAETIMITTKERLGNTAMFGAGWLDEVNQWKRDADKRVIRRFYTGNILSGIVQAAEDKLQSAGSATLKDFFLSRFTNIDGSITTAVELRYESAGYALRGGINVSDSVLKVSCDSPFFLQYASDLQNSLGDKLNVSIFPLWNIESEKVNDRAIAVVRRLTRTRDAVGNIVVSNMLQFEIVQSATRPKDKAGVTYTKAISEKEAMYNFLYHDVDLLSKFDANKVRDDDTYRPIDYAQRRTQVYNKKTFSYDTKTKYNNLYVKIKTYSYDLDSVDDVDALKTFLIDIYSKYEVSFNFRSDASGYLNVDQQDDVFTPGSEEGTGMTFPEGEYEYVFIRKISDAIYDLIPNKIGRSNSDTYGGVRLSQPLSPDRLPSFEMKPFEIPNEILVKLAFSVLDSIQKTDFLEGLKQIAAQKTDIEVGEYVRKYLTKISVPIVYFFGDMRGSEYGKIMKNYALNEDISSLIFDKQTQTDRGAAKTEITIMDAEDVILKLLSTL
jgi:hypothetical protein